MSQYTAIKNNANAAIKNQSPFLMGLAQSQLDQFKSELNQEQVVELQALLSTKLDGNNDSAYQPQTVNTVIQEDVVCEVCAS